MDATLIEELERYRFSLARRIFVMGEMQCRAEELGLEELANQIGEWLAAEREGLHREVKLRNALWDRCWLLSGEARSERDEGYFSWLRLIAEIQRQGTSPWILEPVYQQVRRLKNYSKRSRRRTLAEAERVKSAGRRVLWADGAE